MMHQPAKQTRRRGVLGNKKAQNGNLSVICYIDVICPCIFNPPSLFLALEISFRSFSLLVAVF